MTTFVLLHGAWHGGWCWRRVSDRLEKLGHKVVAPTLTGLGERSHPGHMLADSLTELWASRLMTYRVAEDIDAGMDVKIQHAQCSMAKLYCSEMAWLVADEMVQIRGGRGFETAESLNARGEAPIPAEQMPTGTVIVHPPASPPIEAVALYARVSSGDQKADLERQLGRLASHASRERMLVLRSVSEVGSGLNGHRAKLMRVLADPLVRAIVVEHRDRLVEDLFERLDGGPAGRPTGLNRSHNRVSTRS